MDTQQLLEAARIIEVLKGLFSPKPNEWIPVIAVIAGALAGGIVSLFPALFLEHYRNRKQSNSVYVALVSEVAALLEIIETRRYVPEVKSIIALLQEKPGTNLGFQVIPGNYSRIYQAHIDKIGILRSQDIIRIVQFHQYIDAVIQDIKPGGIIASGCEDIDTFKDLLAILEKIMALGKEIVENSTYNSMSRQAIPTGNIN